jgi:hypothetical protein
MTELLAVAVGAMTSVALAMAPWMFMVHAKLAVLTAAMIKLESKVDKLLADQEQRLPMCALHDARLDRLETHVSQVLERLREIS